MPFRNLVLCALDGQLQSLVPHFRKVEFADRQVIYDRGDEIRTVYFPVRGLISKTTLFGDGSEMDLTLMGRCGLIGTPVLFGSSIAITRDVCHLGGEALAIGASTLMGLAARSPQVRAVLGQCCAWDMDTAVRNGACNARHSVEQRLARTLLSCADVLGADSITLPQQVLANMLGVQRTTINPILRQFQEDGLASLARGRVILIDKAGLATVACECYASLKRDYPLTGVAPEALAPAGS